MNFSSDTNLTYRSSIAVVSALWSQESICRELQRILFDNEYYSIWPKVENYIVTCIHNLILPERLKFTLLDCVQPIGKQIIHWISVIQIPFQTYADFSTDIKFIWTDKGTIDYVLTAELIIRNNPSNIFLCFSLACIFCIEEIIVKLQPLVLPYLSHLLSSKSVFVVLWSYSLDIKKYNVTDLVGNNGEIENALLGCCLAKDISCVQVLSYFLEKLSQEKKSKLINRILQNIFQKTRPRDGKFLIVLFSQLESFTVDDIIKTNAFGVLSCFLEWPCQEFFLPVANSSWNYLSNSNYLHLFLDLVECVSRFDIGNLYKNIVKEFWQSTPSTFKEYIVLKSVSGTFMSRLFFMSNTDDIIQMILEGCSSEEKLQIIFYFESMNICDLLVKKNRWDSLKMFVLSCIPSRDVMNEFIIQYENFKPCYHDAERAMRTKIFTENIKEWY